MLLLLLIILILMFSGGGYYGYRRQYYGGGGLGLIGLIVLLLLIFSVLGGPYGWYREWSSVSETARSHPRRFAFQNPRIDAAFALSVSAITTRGLSARRKNTRNTIAHRVPCATFIQADDRSEKTCGRFIAPQKNHITRHSVVIVTQIKRIS